MKPCDLEHILRAAGKVTGSKKFIVIGSAAIIGNYPRGIDFETLPTEIWKSREADIIPEDDESLWEVVEQNLGENSFQNVPICSHCK